MELKNVEDELKRAGAAGAVIVAIEKDGDKHQIQTYTFGVEITQALGLLSVGNSNLIDSMGGKND